MNQDRFETYESHRVSDFTSRNPYVGRGIIYGITSDGEKAVSGYFIMGRSSNSRNRRFLIEGDDVKIEPYDVSKVEDPSLIIYYPVRTMGNTLVVTNGDQTDTIAKALNEGTDVNKALMTRDFEPDSPNYTPRISLVAKIDQGIYQMSLIKSGDPHGKTCSRYFFEYENLQGTGRFIHTYESDGDPLPPYMGEPERIQIPDKIDDFTDEIWSSLDDQNRISLYMRYTDIDTLEKEERVINKYE